MFHYDLCCMLRMLLSLTIGFIGLPSLAQPILQTAGSLDRNFNTGGLSVDSQGAQTFATGAYSGAVIIDFGGRETFSALSIDQLNNTLFVASRTTTGPGVTTILQALGIVAVSPSGTLIKTFNPSGISIDSSGNPTSIVGYSGALVISLETAGNEGPAIAVDNLNNRVIAAIRSRIGPTVGTNLAIVAVKADGSLDRLFNPSGLTIQTNGVPTSGGFSGALFLGLNAFEVLPSIVIDPDNGIISAAFLTIDGFGSTPNLGIARIKPDGSLDRSFNPSGLAINNAGNALTGGDAYSGILYIDLGVNEFSPSIALDPLTKNLVVGVHTNAGPGPIFESNLGVVIVNPSGIANDLLDRTFNPLGAGIDRTGNPTFIGGYSGAILIDLGGSENRASVGIDSETPLYYVAVATSTGAAGSSIGIVALTPTGLLDRSFNPDGFSIDSNGNSTAIGGYSGTLLVSMSDSVLTPSLQFDAENQRVFVAMRSSSSNPGLGLVSVKPDGSLDTIFNPNGFLIDVDGSPTSSLPGYIGGLFVRLGGGTFFPSLQIDTDTNELYASVQTNTGPGVSPVANLGIIAINGRTIFGPPAPVSPLFQLPFVVMSAA